MSVNLVISNQSGQDEIAQMRADLTVLAAELRTQEAELATLQTELRTFESRYLNVVGNRYDELAEIEKQIAQLQGLDPDEAEETAGSLADDEVGCGQNRFHSDKLRRLYREVCRRFHPDLSADEQEREHRHQLMIEINQAYKTGAEDRLTALLEAGAAVATEGSGESSTEQLVLVRRLAEMKARLLAVEQEIAEITASETWRLKLRVSQAEASGVDLLADLVAQVERQITKARNRLEAVQSVMLGA